MSMFHVVGIEIIRTALRVPITQIVKNTGVDPTRVVETVVNANQNMGYDALTGAHVDMMGAGIVDPTKVSLSQNPSAILMKINEAYMSGW